MLHLDDVQLYDLSEAGPLLFRDPVRLAREARIRAIPSARLDATPSASAVGLPVPWVEAEAGISDADAISLSTYWLGRLAPPAPGARKPRRGLDKLPATDLLDGEAAAARLFATLPALARLDAEGRMPALRVDGAVRYDEALVDAMLAEHESDDARSRAEERRALVRSWARYEYSSDAPAAAPPPRTVAAPAAVPAFTLSPEDAPPAAHADDVEGVAEDVEVAESDAPAAYEIPTDLGFDAGETTSDLLEIDGFDTVDED